MSFLVTTANYQ